MAIDIACAEVREWLALEMCTGRCSEVLAQQLARQLIEPVFDVHSIYNTLESLEFPDRRRLGLKHATPFKHEPLKGLWHQHWFDPRFLTKNLLGFLHSKAALPVLESMVDAVNRGDDPGQFAYPLVVGGFEQRANAEKLTGEWIVFAKGERGNAYLTIAFHTEDSIAILERVRACLKEFPEIVLIAEDEQES